MAPTFRRYKAISPADSSAQALPLPPDQLLEEERQPTYDAVKFFPAKLYQVLRKRYQLVAKLGYGATSTVWLAMDLKTHHHVFSSPPPKYVAVKILRQTFTTPYTTEPEKHELAMVNAIKATRSKHPGREFVSTVRKSFETSSPFGGMHTCLVSDVMCEPLSTLQQRFEGGMTPLRFLKLICQDVLQGLQFLHQDCHLVHTDIKPDNIMLSLTDVSILDRIVREELHTPLPQKQLWDRTIYLSRSGHGAALNVLGRAKITDFGLAVRGDGELLTHAIHPNGYRAPEVVLGAEWRYGADIWNLGCVVVEAGTGHGPFDGPNPFQTAFTNTDHLAKMIALIGNIPVSMLSRGSRSSRYFDERGQFRYPDLVRVYGGPNQGLSAVIPPLRNETSEDVADFISFLALMLRWRPEDRRSTRSLLEQPFLNKNVGLPNGMEQLRGKPRGSAVWAVPRR